jgi:hypothetical protein
MEVKLSAVNSNGREVLIPFVASECQVDLGAKAIRLSLPDGILDL